MNDGDVRSVLASGDVLASVALIERRSGALWCAAVEKARHDLPTAARLLKREADLTWHDPSSDRGEEEQRNGLWWINEAKWELRADGIALASHETFDMHELQREWACGVAWHGSRVWEDWAREHAPEHLSAPLRAIAMAWAHIHEDATDEELQAAREATWEAHKVAKAARAAGDIVSPATWASWAADSAAASTAWVTRDAARATWAAARATRAAVGDSASSSNAAWVAEYNRLNGWWSLYVFERALERLRQID